MNHKLKNYKSSLSYLLSQNPFPRPLTQGFFYREKMRAIHRIAPDQDFREILEVGGGRSGLTTLLYPQARITNLDLVFEFHQAPCNQQDSVNFLCADATVLPFDDHSFDAITMFDVLEHIPNHQNAVSEALRVLRPGGVMLISVPNENWDFPYYKFMQPICPTDADMIAEWGHARRGYTLGELEDLIGLPCQSYATFINPLTILCHDVAFSHLPFVVREMFCLSLSPLTWLSYSLHKPNTKGTETASAWRKV